MEIEQRIYVTQDTETSLGCFRNRNIVNLIAKKLKKYSQSKQFLDAKSNWKYTQYFAR